MIKKNILKKAGRWFAAAALAGMVLAGTACQGQEPKQDPALVQNNAKTPASPTMSLAMPAAEAPDYDNGDKWSEGTITHNGQKYRFNKNIRTYLFLGIDTDEPVHKAKDGISGGQSDALFLLVENRSENRLSIIPIHRNTLVPVQVYERDGSFSRQQTLQICLQHGYGDGGRVSCQRTVDCVSKFLFGIPINGYFSLNMGGIPALNDAIGGVELTVHGNFDNKARNVHLTDGETKVLNGNEAYVYVRMRDINEFDSASDRLEREKQYLGAMLPQAQKKVKSVSSAAEIYESAEQYICSNIDYARLADELKDMQYDGSRDMYQIPGEVKMGDEFEEFHADEKGLYELILNVFYEKLD